MSFGAFDHPLFRDLFGDAELGQLFSANAEVRAMMLLLGHLAKAQGAAGVIPETSAAFLHRAAMEVQIDPAGLAGSVGANGVTVPGLVAAMREALNAPEHANYLHWGATSQDIQDTALMLRMRQALGMIERRLGEALGALADLAEAEAETPQAARTYGQVAVPSSFGALAAAWGWPLIRLAERLAEMKAKQLRVSLSGAAGTGSRLGPDPAAIRAAMAASLGLADPGHSWHATRDGVAEIAGWLSGLCVAGGKMGEDLLRLTRSEVAEVTLGGGGASSTMPQKQNPVGPSVLVALARYAPAQAGVLHSACVHGEARDGAAWFTEWLALPNLVAAAGKSISLMGEIAQQIEPNRGAMAARLEDPIGLIHAEALSFALAAQVPRAEAQAAVKGLAREAMSSGKSLVALVSERHPPLALPDLTPPSSLGQAPGEARAFADQARQVAGQISKP